ncbi:MAG: hypothetical protein WAN86_14455, partial [Hyphomicrobiaceae bacterium]
MSASQASHLVVTVHGIRTYGQWQERLEALVKASAGGEAIQFSNYRFGIFSALSFAIPPLRWWRVRQFRRELMRLCELKGWTRIDLVGHSFGTYLIAWAIAGLPKDSKLSFHTVILSGSVLRSAFPWHEYLGRRILRLINDCGSRDGVLLLSQFFVFFTGMAGRSGFTGSTGESFRNRHSVFGHSGYFVDALRKPTDDYMREHWLPLLASDGPAAAFDLRPPPTPLDIAIETLATHAGIIKLVVYLTP